MIIWIDAQLSPSLAPWITQQFEVKTQAVRDLGLMHAQDLEIYQAARKAKAVVMTKDSDFLTLRDELGSDPQILWINCGNTSNTYLQRILLKTFPDAIQLLKQGEPIVEIRD